MTSVIAKNQQKIKAICEEDGISYLAVFGSQARGNTNKDSDVDLLVKYNKPVGFFDLYESEEKFRQLFGIKVDLITVNGLKKHLFPYIKPDMKVLYGIE